MRDTRIPSRYSASLEQMQPEYRAALERAFVTHVAARRARTASIPAGVTVADAIAVGVIALLVFAATCRCTLA